MTDDRTSTHSGARPPHGSAAEEAARLVEELGAWARRVDARRAPDAGGPAEPDGAGGPDGTDGPQGPRGSGHACPEPSTCRVCPLCQGAALLRGLRPEVVEHLVVAASSLAAALREVVTPPQRTGRPPAEPDVEQIRVFDDDPARPADPADQADQAEPADQAAPTEPTDPTGQGRDREST